MVLFFNIHEVLGLIPCTTKNKSEKSQYSNFNRKQKGKEALPYFPIMRINLIDTKSLLYIIIFTTETLERTKKEYVVDSLFLNYH